MTTDVWRDMRNAYPSMEELVPLVLQAKLPALLIQEVRDRYYTLGAKYQTQNRYEDGRYINGMVYTDRYANAREEVVDAVFCLLGQIFLNLPKDEDYIILEGLTVIYSLLRSLEAGNALAEG